MFSFPLSSPDPSIPLHSLIAMHFIVPQKQTTIDYQEDTQNNLKT